MDELNKAALEHFVYQPVSRDMISYLADAAHNALPPTPPRSPEPRCARAEDDSLPTLDEFITQLVVSSNVQVPTLMSTLVYLTRLKAKLQPMARGLRCTTHRIFLASLILAAKYLNDSSPKNKHWANYTHIATDLYSFGFTRTEVNLMEKQLLFLLEWDLRISEQDLYRELDVFLEPLRVRIAERHARKMRQREEKRRQQDLYAAASTRYPSPVASRATSRSRNASLENLRPGSVSPPGLTYSSSASSYASSAPSSRQQSRSTTPLESDPEATPYETPLKAPLYDSPVQIVVDADSQKAVPAPSSARMLPYEISVEHYHQMHDGAAKKRHKRGMWGRLLGGAVTVR
ncbi:cyclin domain-containing protein [Hirsutella rhossiliensis]|uniref:Cyclin domain-containing protein n=1 Tax=Hirsutella rhossiliensis TaxID=111463 RepID=A0A9P8MT13_9HYPO|nr:cyclin domain-containing protein [Hirsutella rhossiliensis]KAH0961618.1 cyclin domain-containing protein [Hirsutella rhossiliensis]